MTNGMTAPATGWRKPPPCTVVRNASETEPGHAGPRPAEFGTMTAPECLYAPTIMGMTPSRSPGRGVLAGRAGVGALATGSAGLGRDRLAGLAATPGQPGGGCVARGRSPPRRRRHGDRRYGRGGAGQPPAPPPGWLAAAGPGAVGLPGRPQLRLQPLRAGGPSGRAAGGRLPGRGPERHGAGLAVVRRVRAAADPDRVPAGRRLGAGGPGSPPPPRRLASWPA